MSLSAGYAAPDPAAGDERCINAASHENPSCKVTDLCYDYINQE